MFLGRNRVGRRLGHALYDLHVGHIQLVAAVRPLVGAHLALDNHAGFLGQSFNRVENIRRNGVLRHHALNDAGAIAELREQELAALAKVVEPAADGDGLAFVFADF